MTLLLEGVSKSFGSVRAVRDVSFSCAAGSITGYIGPNGSGKSTTLRMIAGLVRPDSGRITIDGAPYASIPNPGRSAGFLLDPAAHHPGRSVRETVALPAIMMGLPSRRVNEVLSTVGLASVMRRKVRALSLGMRQRLSLAIALLGEPGVLVLDEPANGLDVEGMAWLKTLLRSLADEGATILVSSHLLNELETYADRAIIIDRGRVLSERRLNGVDMALWTFVSGPDLRVIECVLRDAGRDHESHADQVAGMGFRVRGPVDEIGDLMWRHHVRLSCLQRNGEKSLEAYYASLTSPEFTANSRVERT
ncbi:ATP-binding cassette domain-containing protein [Sinomonas sp. JGH33]|uniref:ATP-binding cassette domain-containing protein n=1 Tax=Sinomonas terricola TaxID=3110330 RepID=A0ABU5T8M7_9MICC|nr:ATP-binding cassette domain-containing protein [Sinomonas sp. JGH33]MEA5456076.1 ATP-binding cassette domain-containing protein [Sinomonas sp. JGH33]